MAATPLAADAHNIAFNECSSALCSAPHKAESTVRYLGIEVDDALEISGQTECDVFRRSHADTVLPTSNFAYPFFG